jgi:glycosyltransferase involved in cell wall biosynthesis
VTAQSVAPIKIGMIAQRMSRLNGGVSESVRLACQALIAAGQNDIQIFTTDDEHLGADRAGLPDLPINIARAFGSRRYGFAPGLIRLLFSTNLDILHVHGIWTAHALAAWIWQRRTGRPVIVTPHGMLEPWILGRSKALKKAIMALYQRDLIRRAARLHVLTAKEGKDVAAVDPTADCAIVPNYVPPMPETYRAQRPLWWRPSDGRRIVILFFGRLHVKKGCVELCDAWEQFCESDPELARHAQLIFGGWNDGIIGFEADVRRAGRRFDNARFVGPQYGDEKWRSMASSQFMILPSKSEGLPMSILEGWSAGLPAIMTEECNLGVGFTAGAAIRITPSIDSIRAGLVTATSMTATRRDALSKAAIRLIADDFSSAAFARRMIAIYAAALNCPSDVLLAAAPPALD